MKVHPDQKTKITVLIADIPPITVPAEYFDFEDIFFKESTALLPEYTEINTHAIDLKKGKQPLYEPIYSLRTVELETWKIYIETNLANDFICPLKSPVGPRILFNKKPNGSLWLCIDYWDLNNITIKN